MVLVFVALLIAVPLAELYVLFQVAHRIGAFEAIVLLVGISVAGGWLVRRVGMSVFARGMAQLADGRVPTDEMISGGAVLVAGALMLTPGFLTDAVGLVLLLPPVRAATVAVVRRRVRGRIAQGRTVGFASRFHTVVDVDDATAGRQPRRTEIE